MFSPQFAECVRAGTPTLARPPSLPTPVPDAHTSQHVCLARDLPFYDDSMAGTYQKIQTHSVSTCLGICFLDASRSRLRSHGVALRLSSSLTIVCPMGGGCVLPLQPEKLSFVDAEETPVDMTDNCKDFIRKLLCHKNERLGRSGVDEIKGHVWFTGTDFDTLRLKTPPIVPELTSVEDSSQFEDVEPADMPIELFKESRKFEGNHLPFVGFSYGIFDPEGVDKDGTAQSTAEGCPTTLAGLAKQVELLQKENSVLELEVSALKAEQAEQAAVKEADEVGTADLSIISHTSMLERSLIEDKDAIKRAQLDAESATDERNMLVLTHAAEVKGLQDQLAIAGSDLEHGANKAHKLEDRLKESVKEGEQLQQQLDVMSAQLEAEHAEKAKLKEATAELETTVLELKAAAKDHKKKTDRAVRAKDQAELLVDDLREKVRKLERTVNREEEAKLELEDYNSTLLKQASELKVKLSVSELANRDLEDECAVLQKQVDLVKKPSSPGDSKPPAAAAEDLATAHADLKRLREKFAELENGRSTDTAELEARLESEKTGKRELTTKLAQAADDADAQHTELASVRSRLSEELENNVDLANELQDGMIEQQDLQAELERKTEKLGTAETELDILTKRLESMDNKNQLLADGIAKLEENLGRATGGADSAQMENAKELIDQAQSTITENVSQLLAYEQQISRLTLDNDRVSAELKLERDEKRKIATTTDSSMSLLKRMSSSHAIGLVAAKQDYEGQIKALQQKVEVMEAERKAIHDQHEADVKYQQQLSRAAVRRQATVKAKDRRTFTDRTNKDLDPETRRIVKQNKQLEQQVQQLALKVDQALHTNKIDLEAVTEEFRAQEEEYREEFRLKEEAYTEQIERLKENIDQKSIETQQMRRATNRITQLYDRELELNPSAVSSPPMAMIQKTLKMQCYVEGCLSRPKRGNMKKHGWETFFCSADNEILKMHLTSDTSTAVETFSIKDMHHVQAVTKEQVIHAKANEVPRIFKLVCVIVSEASKEIYPENCVHSVLEKDVYHFRGHVFEKSVSKKAELCTLCHKATVGISSMSMLGSGKNRGYQCKFCKKVTHLKHVREDDNGLNDCKGSIELKEILLMADTEEDRQRWVTHLSDMIVQRGTTAAITFKTPAKSKPDDGTGELVTPLRESPSGLIAAVREARELSKSVE